MALASSIACEQNARTSGSASMSAMVAPVIADTGFIVRLPHSLYQTSCRTSAATTASKPASASTAASRSTRSEVPPAGSPTISRRPTVCCTRPGSGHEVPACTTQPTTCGSGIAAAMRPPGSMLASGASPSASMPWPNHHGTPFMAGSTTVRGPSSGAMRGATAASAGPLTATTTRSCRPRSAGSSDAPASGALSNASPMRSRQPRPRSAARVAPRATALTSHEPPAASRVPMKPPIAPAPTMQTFTGTARQALGR